jgi:hypothetical protein
MVVYMTDTLSSEPHNYSEVAVAGCNCEGCVNLRGCKTTEQRILSSNESNVPPAFQWTLLPPEHPERMKKVLAYLNAGAPIGVGKLEWDTIKAALQKCTTGETPVVDPRIREIMECNDPGNAKTIYGTAKAGEQRTQVCDCDVGLCCKTNRRTNQYCRIDPPLANGAVSIKSLDVTALSEDAPYCRYQEKGRTCKCNPVCVTCGWGQHATIHEVALTYPGAHQFEPMSEHQ